MFGDGRHKNELKHECELVGDDDVTSRYIYHGLLVGLRRCFRKWMLVDRNNPRNKNVYKSMFIITRESYAHLEYNYYMIHPFSQFRVFWEILQIFSITIGITCTALRIMLHIVWLNYISTVCSIMTVFDILMTFNTGYLQNDSNVVLLDRRKVAKDYLKTTFTIEVLSLFEVVFIEFCLEENHPFSKWNYRHLLNCVIWFRCYALITYINQVAKALNFNFVLLKLVKIVLLMILLTVWMTSLTLISSFDALHTNAELCMEVIHEVLHMLFLYGIAETPNDAGVMICQIVCLTVGFIFYLMVLCQFLQIYTKHSWSRRKYYQTLKEITEYMRYKALPPMLQSKILKYFDYRFELSYYQEQDIMKILSPHLQLDVMLQAHMHRFATIPLFEDIPLPVIFEIIMKMKMHCYMPSDVIISAGKRMNAMYFINSGAVAVYTAAGKESTHYADGEHFGEMTLISDARHSSEMVVAIDCCEIFILKRRDFLTVLGNYPEVYDRVLTYINDYITKIYMDELSEDIISNFSNTSRMKLLNLSS